MREMGPPVMSQDDGARNGTFLPVSPSLPAEDRTVMPLSMMRCATTEMGSVVHPAGPPRLMELERRRQTRSQPCDTLSSQELKVKGIRAHDVDLVRSSPNETRDDDVRCCVACEGASNHCIGVRCYGESERLTN